MTGFSGDRLRITQAQRRHLEVSLGHILGGIEDAQVWLHRWPLPGHRQEVALRDLETLEARIHEVAEQVGLSLSAFRPDPLRRLKALASEWWSTALDCRSEVLRGYGTVDPSTGLRLDPLLDGLAAALLAVGQSSADDPPGPDSDSDERPVARKTPVSSQHL